MFSHSWSGINTVYNSVKEWNVPFTLFYTLFEFSNYAHILWIFVIDVTVIYSLNLVCFNNNNNNNNNNKRWNKNFLIIHNAPNYKLVIIKYLDSIVLKIYDQCKPGPCITVILIEHSSTIFHYHATVIHFTRQSKKLKF